MILTVRIIPYSLFLCYNLAMWKFLRDIKIKYKLFFIFSLLLIITIESWLFSFSAIRDIDDSFQRLETYAVPSLLATSELKDNLHFAFSNAADYVSSGNIAYKERFQKNFQQAVAAEIDLFQLSQTEQDFEFTQLFEEQINTINTSLSEFIEKYEDDPDDFNFQLETANLTESRDNFDKFLEEQITIKIQVQTEAAAEKIDDTLRKINIYLFIVLGVIIFIVIALLYFISNNITKPVNRLTVAARKMGEGKFEPVELKRKDELGLFAQTFNKMGKDITTAQKDLEAELIKTKQLDSQKTEFLSVAAHQLRTPMAGIKWVLKMIAEGDMGTVTKEQKHHLLRGVENSERMIGLINSLLDITKMQEQKFQYKIRKLNIVKIIKQIIEGLADNANEKQITVNYDDSAELPEINLDLDKITIAITNLIDNAIKYSPEKSQVTIKTNLEKNKLVISVTDQGYGIPKKQQNQVFDKFFRGSNILKIETEYKTIGNGLGLYITKDIIDKHEGDIGFESAEGKGTTFYIKVPLNLKVTAKGTATEDKKIKKEVKKQKNLSPEEVEKIKQKYQNK